MTNTIAGTLVALAFLTGAFAVSDTGSPSGTVKSAVKTPKYFEVLQGPSNVLKYVNPQSPILGPAFKNETFLIVYAGTSWCQVIYKNDTGWIDISKGRIVDSPTVINAKIPGILVFALIAGGGLLVVALAVVFIVVSTRRQRFKRISLRRDVLIISPVEKEIRYSLTDLPVTLPRCFSEIGFQVSISRDLDHARNLLMHYVPDIVVVDWRLGRNIQSAIEAILSDKESISSIPVIFFNVSDPTEMTKRNTAPDRHYLGLVFSDRDIFKIVTPLIMSGKTAHSVKKSVQASALEGAIIEGNLVEVMQFIEIGKKTGCLYATVSSPMGLIYFEQGRITYAATKSTNGKDAINEILNLKEGHFHFVVDKVPSTRNLNLSTLQVLMDWTKEKDETSRS